MTDDDGLVPVVPELNDTDDDEDLSDIEHDECGIHSAETARRLSRNAHLVKRSQLHRRHTIGDVEHASSKWLTQHFGIQFRVSNGGKCTIYAFLKSFYKS